MRFIWFVTTTTLTLALASLHNATQLRQSTLYYIRAELNSIFPTPESYNDVSQELIAELDISARTEDKTAKCIVQ